MSHFPVSILELQIEKDYLNHYNEFLHINDFGNFSEKLSVTGW